MTQHTAWLYYLASVLIAKGADIKTVQARMRHASARTTLDTLDRLELPIEQIGRSLPLKLFTADPDTGMSCALLRYDAGFVNPWHTTSARTACLYCVGTLHQR